MYEKIEKTIAKGIIEDFNKMTYNDFLKTYKLEPHELNPFIKCARYISENVQ